MIKQLASLDDNDDQVKTVQLIISSLGTNYRDFVHASEIYNSVFFRNETEAFKQDLCKALVSHFAGMTNTFWEKVVGSSGTPGHNLNVSNS